MAATLFFVHDILPVWLGLMWLASIRWTHQDARLRLLNRRAVRTATLASAVLPFLGALIWACVRPVETLAERRHRRLARLLLEPAPETAA